jgi:hypothetical protein
MEKEIKQYTDDQLLELYNSGLSLREMQYMINQYGYSYAQIQNRLKRHPDYKPREVIKNMSNKKIQVSISESAYNKLKHKKGLTLSRLIEREL